MRALTPSPEMQFFGYGGEPLGGGTLYTYEKGTTIPLETWTDKDGTTSNENPITLDSDGRCSLWLDAPCTLVLYDREGRLRPGGGDVDPISGFATSEDLENYSTTEEVNARFYTQSEVDDLLIGASAVVATAVGNYIDVAGDDPPDGALVCDGAAYSREVYDELFAVIGTTYGAGNGTTTFNVPDWRGYGIKCVDDGAGRDLAASSRTNAGGGRTGDKNGTVQGNMTARPNAAFYTSDDTHYHKYNSFGYKNAQTGAGKTVIGDVLSQNTTSDTHDHYIASGGDVQTCMRNRYQLRCIIAE